MGEESAMHAEFWFENQEKRDHQDDIDGGWRMIFK
jgi:hypothetical protein